MMLASPKVSLETVKPKDIPQIISWSVKTRDSYFITNSILPLSSDDLALELGDLTRQLYMIKVQDKPQGIIKVFNTNLAAGRSQIALNLQASNFNTKILQEALEITAERLFTRQNVEKIYCHCLPYETEYKKILTALSFRKEGAYKEHLIINGKYHDLEVFAVSKNDYYK